MLDATLDAWWSQAPWVAVALIGAGAAVALDRALRSRPKAGLRLHAAAVAAAILSGVGLAVGRLWLCDDAYISFRYARNLARGHGLVFNPGEWVEGYTNFLWTAALGGLNALGLDVPITALVGNLIALALVLLLTAGIVRRASPDPPAVPVATLACALCPAIFTFGSSGLETMPAVALVLASVWATVRNRVGLAGLLAVLAGLTRPDHLLFWGCLGLALVAEDLAFAGGRWRDRLRWRRYAAFSAPLFLLYLPYFLWRWSVYGDLFPNTYYAKAGGSAYYSQGCTYVTLFLFATGAVVALVVAAALLSWRRTQSRDELRLRVFTWLAVTIFGHYVARVGGDFMEHRFLVVLLPILLVSLEVSVRDQIDRVGRRARAAMLVGATLAIAFVVSGVEPLNDREIRWGITPEYSHYRVIELWPLEIDSPYFRWGRRLGRVFDEIEARPTLAFGSPGLVGYYSDLPIFDAQGLTNRSVAHRAISRRGRPGHEKRATVEDARAAGVTLTLIDDWVGEWRAVTRYLINGVSVWALRYDAELAAALAQRRDVQAPPPVRRSIAAAASLPNRAEVVAALAFYRTFLADEPTAPILLSPLRRRLAAIADFEEGLQPRVVSRGGTFEIDAAPPGWPGGGDCLLSSDGPATGELFIPLRPVIGRELRFVHQGLGRHETQLRIGDTVLRRATPTRVGRAEPVVWDVSDVVGRAADLVIVDRETTPGAYYRVDAIHYPGQPDPVAGVCGGVHGAWALGPELLDAAAQELPGDHPALACVRAESSTFDELTYPAGSLLQGSAFGRGPVTTPLPAQQRITGQRGPGFVNSYHGGDHAVGTLALPPVELPAGWLSVRVGGGGDCRTTYLALEVGGKTVWRACGRRDEVLRRRDLDLTPWAGQRGRIVAVDQGKRAWDHILLDELTIWGIEAADGDPESL